jgi:hypothetical protein
MKTRAYLIIAIILLFGSIANSAKAQMIAHIAPNLVLFEMNGVRILASCTTHNWAFPDQSNKMWQAQPGSLMFGWINNACNEGVI